MSNIFVCPVLKNISAIIGKPISGKPGGFKHIQTESETIMTLFYSFSACKCIHSSHAVYSTERTFRFSKMRQTLSKADHSTSITENNFYSAFARLCVCASVHSSTRWNMGHRLPPVGLNTLATKQPFCGSDSIQERRAGPVLAPRNAAILSFTSFQDQSFMGAFQFGW